MSISWPALIKYSGDDELLFVKDDSVWLSENLNTYAYHADDIFVDSNGLIFNLDYDKKSNQAVFKARQKVVTIGQFEEWLKNHMVVLNQCCSSKLTLPSIKEGFILLEQQSN